MKTRGDVLMKAEEARRAFVIEQAVAGAFTVREAGEVLGLSYRQVIRLKNRYRKEGAVGLVHKGRGKASNRRIAQEIRKFVAEKAKSDFEGASCQHMEELFASRYGLELSAKSIGRILKEQGVACAHRHRSPKGRRCRERSRRRGDLVQMDASPFDWLGDGVMRSLHGAIDDATGEVVGLWIEKNECLSGYLRVLRQMLERHGVPRAIYADRHTIFVSPKTGKLTIEEELQGKVAPQTQFGRVLETLGVRFIAARSPQAKGRIERLWRTLQSRLVIAFRLAGIRTVEAANDFLGTYAEQMHNPKFAGAPAEAQNAFLPVVEGTNLDLLLARHEQRKACGDSTVAFGGQKYRLQDSRGRTRLLRRGKAVTVVEKLDDELMALADGEAFVLVPVVTGKSSEEPASEEKSLARGAQEREQTSPAAESSWHWYLHPREPIARAIHNPQETTPGTW